MYIKKFVHRTFGSACSLISNPEHNKVLNNNENYY